MPLEYKSVSRQGNHISSPKMCCWQSITLRPAFRRYKVVLVLAFLITFLLLVVVIMRSFNSSPLIPGGRVNIPLSSSEVDWSRKALKAYQESASRGQMVYGIIFDAGSTGSRIHVYKFNYTMNKPQPFVLLGEVFEQVRPGLSAYANRPGEAAQSLRNLVASAKRAIPATQWAHTAMALRATAGLRMLPEKSTERILQEVTTFLSKSGFHLVQQGVTIMDGLDEGVFSWLTLNFLSEKIPSSSEEVTTSNTYGALDLGGGSTQITYLPGSVYEKDGERPLSPIYLHHIQLAKGHKMQLYSHSYLGLGLMAARFNLLGGLKVAQAEGDGAVAGGVGAGPDSNELSSPCIPPGHKSSWDYNGKTYRILSKASSAQRFSACYEVAQDMLTEAFLVDHPRELNAKSFFAFSYFYDKAVEVGLIQSQTGGQLHLSDFFMAAQKACSDEKPTEPFLCMDLSYISALLHDGYRFRKTTSLILRKKINGVELSWGLGAMFDVFYKYQLA